MAGEEIGKEHFKNTCRLFNIITWWIFKFISNSLIMRSSLPIGHDFSLNGQPVSIQKHETECVTNLFLLRGPGVA